MGEEGGGGDVAQWQQPLVGSFLRAGSQGSSAAIWLGLLELILITSVCWLGWYAAFLGLCRRVLPALIMAQLITMSQIVLSLLSLGLAGQLYPSFVALTNVGLALIVWVVLVRPRWHAVVSLQQEWWEGIRRARLNLGGKMCLVAFGAAVLWNMVLAIYLPPRDWDSLAYHLPIAATYYQDHAIRPITSPSVWVRYYPIDGELLQLWNVIFMHDDRFIEIAFLPAVLVGLLAIYGLARELGASRSSAVLGAGVMAFATATLVELATSLNDALLAAIVAMGMYIVVALMHNVRSKGNSVAWIAAAGVGAAGGLCAGIKFNGAVYSAGLVAIFFLARTSWRRKGRAPTSARVRIRYLAAIVPVGLALSIYPLLRNSLTAGNPLAPFEIHVGGWRIFEGQKQIEEFVGWTTPQEVAEKPLLLRLLALWREPTGSVYDLSLSGLGGAWFAVGLPAGIVWLGIALWRRRMFDVLVFLALLLGAVTTPAMWNPRYIMPVLIWGSISTALLLDQVTPGVRRGASALLLCLYLLNAIAAIPPYSAGVDDLQAVVDTHDGRERSSPQFMNPNWGRAAFAWIDAETREQPATIAYGKLVPFIYPLYGTDLRNKVVHVLPTTQHDWLAVLRMEKVSIVIVNRGTPQYEWTQQSGEFAQVIEDVSYVVLKRIP